MKHRTFLTVLVAAITILWSYYALSIVISTLDGGPKGIHDYQGRVVDIGYFPGEKELSITLAGMTMDRQETSHREPHFRVPAGLENQITLGKVVTITCEVRDFALTEPIGGHCRIVEVK